MPQRRLINEVRILVDSACLHCSHVTCHIAIAKVKALAMANPHNFWSMKVEYNVGKRRHERLSAWGIRPPA